MSVFCDCQLYIYCLWYILEDLCRENCDSISTHHNVTTCSLSLVNLKREKKEVVDDFGTFSC